MLSKLAFQNLRSSKGYFFAYILTISLFITIVYQIANVQTQIDAYFLALGGGSTLEGIFYFVKVFFYIIVGIFAAYVSRFFVKRRSKEIALLKTMGLNNRGIFSMFAIENVIVILCAFVIGVVMGVLASRLFSMLVINLVGIQISEVGFAFTMTGLQDIVVLVFTFYIIITIIPIFTIFNTSIVKLFQAQVASDKRVKTPIPSLILFLIFTALLIYQAVFYIPTVDVLSELNIFLYIINACLVAVFLYRGFLVFIFNNKRNRESRLSSIVRLLSFNHLSANIRSLYKMMAIITVSGAILVATIILSFGYINTAYNSSDFNSVFIVASKNDTINHQVKKEVDKVSSNSYEGKLYYKEYGSKKVFVYKMSDYIKLNKAAQPDLKINAKKPIVSVNEREMISEFMKLAGYKNYKFNDREDENLYNKTGIIYEKEKGESLSNQFFEAGFVVLPDNNKVFSQLSHYPYVGGLEKVDKDNVFSYFLLLKSNALDKDGVHLLSNTIPTFLYSKVIVGILQLIVLLIMIMISISLLMAIFFRNLENLEKGLDEYIIAKSIGMSKKQIVMSNLIESAITQLLPFVIGVVCAIPLMNQLFFSEKRIFEIEDLAGTNVITYLSDPMVIAILGFLFLFLVILVCVLMVLIVKKIDKTKQIELV